MDRRLKLTALSHAISSLEKAIQQPKDEFIRDSVIRRFEYTYELAWKSLKRHLEWDEGVENVDHLTRRDVFRLGAEKGLIDDVGQWFAFHVAGELGEAFSESNLSFRTDLVDLSTVSPQFRAIILQNYEMVQQ